MIGVRYCGGCNPRYDRVAVIKQLQRLLPDEEFESAQPGTPYSAVVVVSGCLNKCAGVADLAVPANRLLYLNGWEDLLPTKKSLLAMLGEQEFRSLSHEEVLAVLPHREPMLWIDTVSRLVPGKEITASFYAAPELPVFAGHFPGAPVFPGVLSVEAVAQAADILLLTQERYAGKEPLFTGIRKATFRRKILPGSTLELHASLLEERPELGYAVCRGQVLVDTELMADMEIQLTMR